MLTMKIPSRNVCKVDVFPFKFIILRLRELKSLLLATAVVVVI